MAQKERMAYLNGQFVPESQATISIHDRGFVYGDATFDATRTFNGRAFKLKEHLDRLYASCQYLGLDPGMGQERMTELTKEILDYNVPLLGEGEDYWIRHRVTRGVDDRDGTEVRSTVLIECMLIPLAQRAKLYREGIRAATPSIPRTPPRFMSPRAKTHNYINLILAEQQVHEKDPDAWALLLDEHGNLAEGKGCNVFIVKNGAVATPREQFVLPGISRSTVMELATGIGIPMEERDIDLYDAYTAQEVFFTSTSLCICPVSSINGAVVGDGKVPGPVTDRLIGAYCDLAGIDFVAQYLAKG